MNDFDFNKFCLEVDPDFQSKPKKHVKMKGDSIYFKNSTGGEFNLVVSDIKLLLENWLKNIEVIKKEITSHEEYKNKHLWDYQETAFREVIKGPLFNDEDFARAVAQIRSQTKGAFFAISKFVGFIAGNNNCEFDSKLLLDKNSLENFFVNVDKVSENNISQIEDQKLKTAFKRVCEFCETYQARDTFFATSDTEVSAVKEALEVLQVWLSMEFKNYRGVAMNVKATDGIGKFPRVPWVGIFPPGQKAIDGIYFVICFGREGSGAVAGCAQSASNPKGLNYLKRTSSSPLLIDVDGTKQSTKYNDVFENPIEILRDEFDPNRMIDHIKKSLDLSFDYLDLVNKGWEQAALEKFQKKLIDDFSNCIKNKYYFNIVDIKRFIVSLLTKPFVILSGNSGTGKTKIAQIFAEWITIQNNNRYALVPVGADWTDNRNIVGFLNLLRKGPSGNDGLFQSTPILDLMLSASDDPYNPYFLILDEMNLSHVERYFSDCLSAMESGKEILLHSEEGEVFTSGARPLFNGLKFPPNLFVVGTVNIDETTYMFSPKVLDRANVIEIKVQRESLETFLESSNGSTSGAIASSPDGMADAFINLSFRARGIPLRGTALPPLDAPDGIKQVNDILMKFFDVLSCRGYEFAFRTASEIHRYIRVDRELTPDSGSWDWKQAADLQILQKLLPKLHGSRRKIEALLVGLAALCEKGEKVSADKYLVENESPGTYQVDIKREDLLLKLSHEKLCEMIATVRRDQFVSFIQ